MAKNQDFSDIFFRLSRAVAVGKICLDTSSVPMKARKLKAHTQKFEIWNS
jgi:hypothetical protein